MTSTQSPTPAQNTTAASTAPSYASAAGATKKPASTPLVVSGGANSVASSSQNASTPVNGRQSMPSVGPTIANGTSSLNGDATEHSRNGSVSITAPGNGFTNAAPGNAIKFGFDKTPQPTAAVPIPAGGVGHAQSIPSPAISPLPIPQPSASGGKPGATESQFKIGSFPTDGGNPLASMRVPNPTSMPFVTDHTRRGSTASHHSEMSHHGGPSGPVRGGFSNRGRGNHSTQYNAPAPGYPPNNYTRGPQQYSVAGRGAMAAAQGSYAARGPMQYQNNSPRIAHGSPAMSHAVPGQGNPQMSPAMSVPVHQQGNMYAPPMSNYGGYGQQGNFNAYNNYDPRTNSYIGMPTYTGPMYPPSPQPYFGAQTFPPPPPTQAPPMSRANSQLSERPASSTGPQGPLGASGPPPTSKIPAIASSAAASNFVKPKRSSAITIKNANGEPIDFKALTKTPASPAPSVQPSKTPPVIASTPTPPPKVPTPTSHARNESSADPNKVKADFAAQVKLAAEADALKAEDKQEENAQDKTVAEVADEKTEDDERKQEEERLQAERKAADEKAAHQKAAEVEAAEIKLADEKAAESKAAEAKAADEKAAEAQAAEAKAAEIKAAEANASEDADKKETAVSDVKVKLEADSKVENSPSNAPFNNERLPGETEDEWFDRLDAEDARKEAEQAKIDARRNAEKEAAKKAAAEKAAPSDSELKEQEREMERLEEVREKARLAEQSGKPTKDVVALLADKVSTLAKDTSDNTDKLSKLTINSSLQAPSTGSAPSSAKSTGKDRRPAALNLAPLKTGSVEAPPPSAAMQALKSSRFLTIKDEIKYPVGIASPNPSINATAAKKGGSFKYDSAFLLQFKGVFTEQPSTEFSQQVKALLGDAGPAPTTRGSHRVDPRSNSKSAGSGGAFGAFTQPKSLPPGTSSEQRFAMSQGQMPRPAVNGPMASFGRPGAFPSGSQTGRAPSGMGMGSRQGSTRTTQPRGNSSRQGGKGYDAQSVKVDKTMPLTAGMDLKPIQVSSTGWKPMSLTRNAQQPQLGVDLLDPATVQRKVKSNLNKMTPENFDKISGQILQIAAQSKDETDGRTLRQVIQLTFEKATDEAHWAAMYAKFCQCMLENMSPEVKDVTITDKQGNVVSGGALFRKYLLNRCQEDFEHGWNNNMPEPKEGESKEAALMSDEYYKAMAIKRRGLGLIQFIGELFRLGMLTERIMHECVRKLLDFQGVPDEATIESLTKLLRTIGADLDGTEKGNVMMNAYFSRIQNLVEGPLPSRLNFMLMDIIDLRKAKWVSKDGPKGPKTRDEIRADAEAALAAKAVEASRSNNRGYQGQGQGRFNSGRGDARGHGGFQPNPASNNVAMDDLRRLKGSASRAASGNVTLGPTSMFNSRSNSGRRMGPGGSLARGADDSGGSSRTGTPGPSASSNTFAALAQMNNNEDGPASPPSAAASPAINHAKPAN